ERALLLAAVEDWKPTHRDDHYKIPGTTPSERALLLAAVEHWKPTNHNEHYRIPGTTPLERGYDPIGTRVPLGSCSRL
ncbi:hypothetical protein JW905_19670, partial [bacterium]|nr:hypothetical protein [candidate division CSSED10-310 bacterium]